MTMHEAFIEALKEQLPSLRRYATALAGNAAMADDLVQDTVERALRRSEQLRELQHLPGWLRRILYNLYVDLKRRSRTLGIQQDVMELVDHLELSTPAQDRALIHDFLKAVDALPVEQRQILLLVGLENLSYREIADELNIPIGTVMSRLSRARERVRELMDGSATQNIVVFSGPKEKL
jgi:RNA polymerase sigma-70 factor (ECF subfamily)